MTTPHSAPVPGPDQARPTGAGADQATPAQPWSEWARVGELDRLLRAAGLPAGPDRWQNAQDLLAALAAGHRLPRDPAQVRPLLAPLFCRSPEEQRRFAEVYAQWLGQDGGRTAGFVHAPIQRAPRPRRPPPQTRLRPILLATALAVCALAVGLYLWLQPPPLPPDIGGSGSVTTPQPVPPPAFEGSDDSLRLPLQPIPPRTPPEVLVPGPEAQRLLATADWLLPALPGVVFLAWLAWRGLRRRDVLRHRQGDAHSPLRHITLAGEDDDLYADPALHTALRRLHTPVRVPTGRLDERATCERTARGLGLFAPVYRELPRVPDLVVLVDFQHRGDHLAALAETLVVRLRDAGLEVHRYPFQRHPARVLGARGQALGLPELAARHAGARLLIVGDPRAFLDPWSGRPADWTEVLTLWPRRALLATRALPEDWRAALTDTGLALAPFGEAGLMRLAGHLTEAAASTEALPDARLPGRLGGLAAALDPAPEPTDRRALLADLDAWLGPRGGLLLAAVAVYPELNPGLTRLLDQALFPSDPAATRAQRLLRLARLPWLRAGHLPDWLRLALTGRTGYTEARRIGAIYRDLLARASIDGEQALRLPVAVPGRPRAWRARLRRSLRERGWRLDRWIRDLAGTAGPDAALQDRIFLDTVLRLRRLDFLLPRWLARGLPRPVVYSRWGGPLRSAALVLLLGLGMHWLWAGSGTSAGLGLTAGLRDAAAGGWIDLNRGLRRRAEAELIALAQRPHRAFQVEVRYIPRGDDPERPNPASTEALAGALAEVLGRSGFGAVSLLALPEPPAPTAGAVVNTVQVGADAVPPVEALGTVQVAPEGTVEVYGTVRMEGLSGAGTVFSGGADKATLILDGDTGRSTDAAVNTVQIGADTTVPIAGYIAGRLRYLAWGAKPQIANLLAEPPPGTGEEARTPPPAETIRVWLRTPGVGGVFAEPLARPLTDAERAAFSDPKALGLPEPTLARPKPFSVFRDRLQDGTEGPAMVALPGGSFLMGSPDTEPERENDEGPQRQVRVGPFAIGRTEVTFADYDRFAEATGRKKPGDRGWGRAERPVITVSWQDATAYAEWLSTQTGQPYRLPTEAEWEYATRAGTGTPFWTGDCIHTDQANYVGTVDYNGCGAKTGLYRRQTVPTGSLPANPWGLYEVAGNATEWVADCWHDSYQGAPTDATAWGEAGGGDCARRVVRGGGWFYGPKRLRSAYRFRLNADDAPFGLGFRLARTL